MGVKTKIEWCNMTWSPVTGCLHGCEYCYARGIAHRFGDKAAEDGIFHFLGVAEYKNIYVPESELQINPYPYGFDPTFHRYLLGQPARRKKPANIFVCSMADLFGAWVPDEWIMAVFLSTGRAMQHNYLFLTKNPARYMELDGMGINAMFNNIWLGATVTSPGEPFLWMNNVPCHSFVSIEPLMQGGWGDREPQKWPEWVIIGALTGPGAKKRQPKAEWVADIVAQCKAAGVPVFMKESLVPVVGENNMFREFPRGLQK